MQQEGLPLGEQHGLEFLEFVLPFEDGLGRDQALGADALQPGDFAADDIHLRRRTQEVGLGLHELLVREPDLEERLVGRDAFTLGHENPREDARHGGDDGKPRSPAALDHHARHGDRAAKCGERDIALRDPDAAAGLLAQGQGVGVGVVVVGMAVVGRGVVRGDSRAEGGAAQRANSPVADRLRPVRMQGDRCDEADRTRGYD